MPSIPRTSQAGLEIAGAPTSKLIAEQSVEESAFGQPANLILEQSVVELPYAIGNTPDSSGTAQLGLPGYVPTTLFIWQIETIPDQVFAWRSQYISHGLRGYQTLGYILASYAAQATVTLSFTAFDGTAPASISLPSTGNQIKRILFTPTFNKFRLLRYTCTSASPFQVLLSDWVVRVGEWGREGSFVSYRLVGEG